MCDIRELEECDFRVIRGTDGADELTAGVGHCFKIYGKGGDDVLRGIDREQVTYGGDVLYGGPGNDVLSGGHRLFGGGGDDILQGHISHGGDGDDRFRGGVAHGGPGNDTYSINRAPDAFDVVNGYYDVENGYFLFYESFVFEAAGEGFDTVRSSVSVDIALYGWFSGNNNPFWHGFVTSEIEKLVLTGSADINGFGNDYDNVLVGNPGDNLLAGGDGHDVIRGKSGADRLDGGLGNDVLRGGKGADAFTFSTDPGSGNVDVVDDFNPIRDVIRLHAGSFPAIPAGPNDSTIDERAFVASAGGVAQDGDDRILYNTFTGALYYDPDGNGPVAPEPFAVLEGAPVVSVADFLLLI